MRTCPRATTALATGLMISLAACAPEGQDAEDETPAVGDDDGEEGAEEPEPELPGGGDTLFPDRRLVGAYGSPGSAELGVLGEGSIDDAVDRVHEYAEDYQEFSEEPVVPAFEIITTVATADPDPEGTYTSELDPETIEPWVQAAAEEDIYVVLDLQPGHDDFLSQAQTYEELLAEPHVGLALDPEWRLAQGQRHMEQVGSVDAAEINEVADWLAELTDEHDLPQKVLMLHQFKHPMITNREDIDTSHDEFAPILHADGHGTPEDKTETWNSVREGLSEDFWMGWKNFYEQDFPTFTPQQTYDVDPQPWFVSYQ